jgi:plastocyanin domain-containing protein
MQRQIFLTLLTLLGLLLSITFPAAAQMHDSISTHQFAQINQPIALKLGVTLGGLTLIGLELWWFLISRPQAQPARLKQKSQTLDQ